MPNHRRVRAASIPHSWDFEHWPPSVYPHTASRARYILRTYRNEFEKQGILSRVGRELVIIGARYARWLELHTADVVGYEVPANRPPQAAA